MVSEDVKRKLEQVAQRLCKLDYERIARYDWDHANATIDKVAVGLRPLIYAASDSLCSESWVDDRKNRLPTGLLILGDFGVGKSSVLFVLLQMYRADRIRYVLPMLQEYHDDSIENIVARLVNQGWVYATAPATILTHSELVTELRNSGITDLLKHKPLFIDDWRRAYSDKAGWNESLEYDLFDYRWRNRLPTFITTNLDPEDFDDKEFKTGANIDRLADSSWLRAWTLTGESRRRKH